MHQKLPIISFLYVMILPLHDHELSSFQNVFSLFSYRFSNNSPAFSWCSWLSHPPNTRKVSGSNPDENRFFFFSPRKLFTKLSLSYVNYCNFLKQQPQQSKEKLSFVKPKKIVLAFATMMMYAYVRYTVWKNLNFSRSFCGLCLWALNSGPLINC